MKTLLAPYFATRARRTTLGVIAACLVFYMTLFAVHFYLRWVSEAWPRPFSFASIVMALALTSFSLSSSVTCEIAARASLLEDKIAAIRWMAVSIVTWLTFAFLELVEWVRIVFMMRLDWTTSFGASYLSIAVSHWIGIAVCAGWMIRVANDIRRRDVIAVAMFSHFLNLIWLAMLILIYLAIASIVEGF